ncbi:hypothetical protein, partial [Tessaracoccus sp. OH4464_COT-324]|uniref:hypothetical protein n=1 Tax=Tessaracoccus sp. OH4464_COT-324 TaxID=2491059 RepID=UPI001319DA5E
AAIAADETELGQQQAHETKLFAQANAAEREQLLRDQARARELASEAVHRAQMMLSSLRARTHLAAQISQGLAQQLHDRAEQWAEKARDAGKLADSLPELILLEGWTGPAARQYGLRAMVQAKAFEEHRQLPALYARLLKNAYEATMLELTFVWHALSEARDANASALRARSA